MSNVRIAFEGDARGALRAMGDLTTAQQKLQGKLRETGRDAQTLGEKLRAIGNTVVTGALHRLGAMILNGLVSPIRLGIRLAGDLLGALLRLGSNQVTRGLAGAREGLQGLLGRPGLGAAGNSRFQSFLDDLSRRTGATGLQQMGNRALEMTGGDVAAAQRLLRLGVDVGAARGQDPGSVVDALGRARMGDAGGLFGLGLNDPMMQHRLNLYQRQERVRGVQGAFGNVTGGGGLAMVGPDALNGTPYGDLLNDQAGRRAAQRLAAEVERELMRRFGGAGDAVGQLQPMAALDRGLDPARRTAGAAVLGYQQSLARRLAPSVGRINDAVEGSDPMELGKNVLKSLFDGSGLEAFAEAFKGSQMKSALAELLGSMREVFGALFSYGLNKALDALAERSPKLKGMLGLQTSQERGQEMQVPMAMQALRSAGMAGNVEALRMRNFLSTNLAGVRANGGDASGLERAAIREAERLTGFRMDRSFDPDLARLNAAMGRAGRAVGGVGAALDDGIVRAGEGAANVVENAASGGARRNVYEEAARSTITTSLQARLKPAGAMM